MAQNLCLPIYIAGNGQTDESSYRDTRTHRKNKQNIPRIFRKKTLDPSPIPIFDSPLDGIASGFAAIAAFVAFGEQMHLVAFGRLETAGLARGALEGQNILLVILLFTDLYMEGTASKATVNLG